MKARIIDIKRFAVHDGDGIRTTVFFKGCPLKCVWCHNPEGILYTPQLAYYENKCMHCAECVSKCEFNAHTMIKNLHNFDSAKCKGCGQCESACLGNALVFYGKEMSIQEILPILLEDKEFYDSSNGGVTLSGGECLMQADFCAELLKKLKQNGIHTAVDTCGYAPKQAIDKVIDYTDVFLYDLKAIDPKVHKHCTGVDNELILENLKYVDGKGKMIEIRVPYVPNYNEKEMQQIAGFVKSLKNVSKVKVLPYHNFAGSKYQALGIENTLPECVPTKEQIKSAEKLFESR